jgi:hypothetical protein
VGGLGAFVASDMVPLQALQMMVVGGDQEPVAGLVADLEVRRVEVEYVTAVDKCQRIQVVKVHLGSFVGVEDSCWVGTIATGTAVEIVHQVDRKTGVVD